MPKRGIAVRAVGTGAGYASPGFTLLNLDRNNSDSAAGVAQQVDRTDVPSPPEPLSDSRSDNTGKLQSPHPFQFERMVGLTIDDLPKDTRYLWTGIRDRGNLNPSTASWVTSLCGPWVRCLDH
jgi:hypothetical protein